MAGLHKNNNVSTMMHWYHLFAKQRSSCSVQAHEHWQKAELLGLPTSKHEHWKYTPLEELLTHCFILADTHKISTADRDALSLMLDAYRLVFINGSFSSELSDKDTGLWKIEIDKGISRQILPAPIQPEVFLHLIESLSQETTRIYLPMNKVAEKPLYLLHISIGNKVKKTLSTMYYRHHIEHCANSHGQVIEHFVSLDQQAHFSNARTSISVGNNAHVNYVKLAFENHASYHFSHNDINIGYDAVMNSSTFILGAKLTRHQTSAQLNGERSNISINSLLIPVEQDISDTRTYLEHNKGYCVSRQLHKIIACNHSKGVFNGLIKVAKYARQTDGKMTNNNLLLDQLAEIDTKPQLEIYADDVKCSHGATIGCIDKEQIFYLQSRGITYEHAQQMIICAFALEVTELINYDIVQNIVLTHIIDALQRGD